MRKTDAYAQAELKAMRAGKATIRTKVQQWWPPVLTILALLTVAAFILLTADPGPTDCVAIPEACFYYGISR